MITQEMKDQGITCKGMGFNCNWCKDVGCVDYTPTTLKHNVTFKQQITSKEISKLENITVLQLVQEIEHALNNDLIYGDMNVIDLLKLITYKYSK